jgi:type II secretion system protein N
MARTKKGYSFWVKAGFVLYAIFCLIVFIYIQFPYDTLKDRMEQTLSRTLKSEVSLGHMHAHLPLGLAADGLDINTVPVATKLTFHPQFTRLFFGSFGMDISAQLLSGEIEGFVATPVGGMGKTVDIVLDAQRVDFAAFSKLLPAHIQPRGIISGHAELQGPPDSIDKVSGSASLVWKDGSLPLSIPTVPLDAIAFKSVEVDAYLDKGMLTIDRGELNGDISGTVKGAIRVRELFERSRLNLTGEVILPDNMKGLFGLKNQDPAAGLKFSLRGTLGSPRFRMLSR